MKMQEGEIRNKPGTSWVQQWEVYFTLEHMTLESFKSLGQQSPCLQQLKKKKKKSHFRMNGSVPACKGGTGQSKDHDVAAWGWGRHQIQVKSHRKVYAQNDGVASQVQADDFLTVASLTTKRKTYHFIPRMPNGS